MVDTFSKVKKLKDNKVISLIINLMVQLQLRQIIVKNKTQKIKIWKHNRIKVIY